MTLASIDGDGSEISGEEEEVDFNDVDGEDERVANLDEVYESDVAGDSDCVVATVFETVGGLGVSKCDTNGVAGVELLDPGDTELHGEMEFVV